MKKRMFEFHCPNCQHSFFMARDTYLIKDEKSLEYKRLKEQTYFRHQCQNCKVIFDLDYPLIYRDPKRKYSLILADQTPNGIEGNCIVTRTLRQFLDAFSILDLGLDLRSVLPILFSIRAQKGEQAKLIDYDPVKGLLWFESEGLTLGVGYHERKNPSNR